MKWRKKKKEDQVGEWRRTGVEGGGRGGRKVIKESYIKEKIKDLFYDVQNRAKGKKKKGK